MRTKFLSFRLLGTVFLLAIATVAGHVAQSATLTPGDCSKITSDKDRLACFEKIFPPERPALDPRANLHDNTQDEKVHLEKSLKSSICKDCVKQSK